MHLQAIYTKWLRRHIDLLNWRDQASRAKQSQLAKGSGIDPWFGIDRVAFLSETAALAEEGRLTARLLAPALLSGTTLTPETPAQRERRNPMDDHPVSEEQADEWLALNRHFLKFLAARKKRNFNRRVSIGDLLSERHDNALAYGFGEGTTMYDNVLVLGDVVVGRNTWIGPGCVLDGSGGGLEIGDWCTICAGVQIYTHSTVNRSISLGTKAVDYAPTKIGHGVYIGPNTVVQMGVSLGDKSVIGAISLVNRDIPPGAKAFGSPARLYVK